MGREIFREAAGVREAGVMKKRAIVLTAFLFFVFLGGCGYTTHAYVAKSGYKTVYIAPFVNKVDTTSEFSEGRKFRTYYPLLENVITNAVVDRYNFDGTLRVSKQEEADIVLKGDLVNYRRETLRSASNDTPEEYRVTIFVNITMSENKTEKVLWVKNNFAGDATYFITGPQAVSESQAVENATKDLARRIVEATVEVW